MTTAEPSSVLEGLTPPQREAAAHAGGPLIVLAGPGSGKTRVLIHRAAHLIAERGVDPANILAITFTNRAAQQLRERLSAFAGIGPSKAERIDAATFNAFGMRLLSRFGDLAGLPPRLQLIDSAQRRRLCREIVEERGLFASAAREGIASAIELALRRIRIMRHAGLRAEDAASRLDARAEALEAIAEPDEAQKSEAATVSRWREAVRLWKVFSAECLKRGWISYDDQVSLAAQLLTEHGLARDIVRGEARHVIVDEFQDVDRAQIDLLRQIAPPESRPDICVVGDDDQSIFGFRGADDLAFDRFERIWSRGEPRRVRTVELAENWRSERPILDVANAVIGSAHHRFAADKSVERAALKDPPPEPPPEVEAVRLENYAQDARVIASMIASDRALNAERRFAHYAVIARTHGDLARIRGGLELEGIPVRASRGPTPADDAGVQDLLMWTQVLLDPTASWAARRILRRPPFGVEARAVTELERAYRAAASRGDVPGYPAWLLRAVPSDDPARASIERFARLHEDLADVAARSNADDAVSAIVTRVGLAHAELLDGPARAAGVSALVRVIRFVRERLDRLDQPRDLAAFMEYYNDLDDGDRTFAQRMDESVETDADPDFEDEGDAVSLLTAHAAKGLEYDTVFLPRVEGQHGYPARRNADDDLALPGPLAGEDDAGAVRTPEEAHADEERRLFYVACTRAERRLVIMGKLPKKAPSGMNFHWELTSRPGLAVQREAADILEAHERDALSQLAAANWKASEARRERLAEARRAARVEAAAALDAADRADITADDMQNISTQLRDAASRLAVIASAEGGLDAPAWVDAGDLTQLHDSLRAGEAPHTSAAGWMRPLTPPLRLSYTWISEYLRCPRCFYVRRMLGLREPPGEAQVVGQAVHNALHLFSGAYREAEGAGEPLPGAAELVEIGDREFLKLWPQTERIDAFQRSQVRAQLEGVANELVGPTDNIEETEHTIVFPYEAGGTAHKIEAKLDRYDRTASGYRIVDYKTGRPTKKLTEPKADDLQLGVYAMALAHELEAGGVDELHGTAEYWLLQSGERGRVGFAEIADKLGKTREKIDGVIAGMLGGDFPRGKPGRDGCWDLCAVLDRA